MGILKLHDTSAIDANEVIVRGLVEKVGVVGGLVVSEIDFTKQIRFDQKTERAIDSGARGFRIEFSGTIKEFICREMFVFGECGLDDGFTLAGSAQPLAADKFVKSFLNICVHWWFLAFRIRDGKRKQCGVHTLGIALWKNCAQRGFTAQMPWKEKKEFSHTSSQIPDAAASIICKATGREPLKTL